MTPKTYNKTYAPHGAYDNLNQLLYDTSIWVPYIQKIYRRGQKFKLASLQI